MTTDNNNRFNTREELEVRKNELLTEIRSKSESIENIWHSLITEKKENNRSELVAGIVSKGIMAFDAFMLVRKLMKQYNRIFRRKKR